MYDIMKASFYSYRKGKPVYYSVFIAILLGVAMGFGAYAQGGEIKEAVMGSIDNWMFNSFLVMMIFTALGIGSDFKNKTIYYEVMSGHKSSEIIIGRMLPTLLFEIIIMSLALIGTYSFGLIGGNWGSELGLPQVIFIRYLLLLWNNIPFAGFCILSIYITKNMATAIALDWGMLILIQLPLLFREMDQPLSPIWLHTNMRNIIGGSLSATFCFGVIIVSTVKLLVMVLLTIWLFERIDLK